MADQLHTVGDGRGPRQVYVDGRPVSRIVIADIKRGVVRQHVGIRGRGRQLLYRAIRGKVTVEPING